MDGAWPEATLIQATDGNLYGTTNGGGAFALGTAFKVAPDGTTTVVHHFSATASDGGAPRTALVQASDGNFYGTTTFGGPIINGEQFRGVGLGTVYRMTPQGGVTVLHSLSNLDGDYSLEALDHPLIQGSDGYLYGTTAAGMKGTSGTFFRISLDGRYELLRSFDCAGCPAASPESALVQGTDGTFYGIARDLAWAGVPPITSVIRLTTRGDMTVVATISPDVRLAPTYYRRAARGLPALLLASDGHFYGTTVELGAVLFRLRVFPDAPTRLTVTGAGSRSVQLAWTASARARSYTVKRRLPGGPETVVADEVTTTSFTDTNVEPGVVYTYVVTARGETGSSAASNPTPVRLGWSLLAATPTVTTVADYDGDGHADLTVYRTSDGRWLTRRSVDAGLSSLRWGSPMLQDRPVPADYDGDGATDLAVYRQTTGEWLIRRSTDGALVLTAWGAPLLGDVPLPADYDGDRRADVAVYRASTGEWLIRRSSDGSLLYLPWGAPALADRPVPGDYDGDGITDVAVYRTTTGEWFIRRAADGAMLRRTWGAPSFGDVPVPADYDGDGQVDLAVFRQGTGEWFIHRSSDGVSEQLPWGAPVLGDVPLPADYDGDGRADLAVYRELTGEWFIRRSSDGGAAYYTWGAPELGDAVRPR
jgi:uncharacterized repeat protein (TIGR03803 family)